MLLLLLDGLASGNRPGDSPRSYKELPAKESGPASKGEKQASERTRVAEGEYQVYRNAGEGGIGPFNPAVYDFRESWTLWRLSDGILEVEGERRYDSPQHEPHMDAFSVKLSSRFGVERITEFKLCDGADSGLTSDFHANWIATQEQKDSPDEIQRAFHSSHRYGASSASLGFLSNITQIRVQIANHPIVVNQ